MTKKEKAVLLEMATVVTRTQQRDQSWIPCMYQDTKSVLSLLFPSKREDGVPAAKAVEDL